jgi:PIN domain nuclease of toxin-antitoxin system
MNYLLDTHTFLWFLSDSVELSATAKAVIEDPQNTIYLSMASVWEMAIKASIGKLELPLPAVTFVNQQLEANDIHLLDIKTQHLGIVETLPFHHKDPFDRLIIAQSISENLSLLSADNIFRRYPVTLIW